MASRGEVAINAQPWTTTADLALLLGRVSDLAGLVAQESIRWRCSREALTYVVGRAVGTGPGTRVFGVPVHVDDRLVHPHIWVLEWGALDISEEGSDG